MRRVRWWQCRALRRRKFGSLSVVLVFHERAWWRLITGSPSVKLRLANRPTAPLVVGRAGIRAEEHGERENSRSR